MVMGPLGGEHNRDKRANGKERHRQHLAALLVRFDGPETKLNTKVHGVNFRCPAHNVVTSFHLLGTSFICMMKHTTMFGYPII